MASWEEFAREAGERVVAPSPLMRVEAWSDGSSRGNPGPGGYGTVLRYTGPDGTVHERELRAATDAPPTTAWSSWARSPRSRPCAVRAP